MERKHEQIAGYDVVVTSNGVTTSTATTMKLAVEEFDWRKPNYHPTSGVWRELALAVRDQIMRNVEWWDQNTWRTFVTDVSDLPNDTTQEYLEREETDAIIKQVIAFEKDMFAPACGTSMCAAGWATEIVRADWVVDSKMVTEGAKKGYYIPDDLSSMLFVPSEWWAQQIDRSVYGGSYGGSYGWNVLHASIDPEVNEFVIEQVNSRGFTTETHAIVTVPAFASAMLGIDGGDLNLFGGDNTYAYVVSALTVLATIECKPSELGVDDMYSRLSAATASLNLSEEDL
jgi:hypothetical protein